jgi:2'-5' RNA ligase
VAHTDDGEDVPLDEIIYPTYDPAAGLQLLSTIESRVEHQADSQEVAKHSGAMVALRPPDAVLNALVDTGVVTEDFDNLHITLAYLPGGENDLDPEKLAQVVSTFALGAESLEGTMGGFGMFDNVDTADSGEEYVLWAHVDIPGLDEWRNRLVEHLTDAGFTLATNHGFTTHLTLAYQPEPFRSLPTVMSDGATDSFVMDEVILSPPDDEWQYFALEGGLDKEGTTGPEPEKYEENSGDGWMTLALGGLQSIESLPAHQRDLAYEILSEANLPEDTKMRSMTHDFGDGVADGLSWSLSRIRGIHFEEAWAILNERRNKRLRRGQAEITTLSVSDLSKQALGYIQRAIMVFLESEYPYGATVEGLSHQTGSTPSQARQGLRSLEKARKVYYDNNDNIWVCYNSARYGQALIHDEPEPALPETDGGEDEEEIPENLRETASFVAYEDIEGSTSKIADLRPAWLAPGAGSSDGDIAKAAREYLAKTALKVFSPAEQQMLIDEGADVVASNLGDLLLEGSHYAELETALKEDEEEKEIMGINELEESSWLI